MNPRTGPLAISMPEFAAEISRVSKGWQSALQQVAMQQIEVRAGMQAVLQEFMQRVDLSQNFAAQTATAFRTRSSEFVQLVTEIAERFADLMPRFEEGTKALAKFGWTLPMSMSPREMLEIVEEREADAIDNLFITCYGEEGELVGLKTALLGSPRLMRWRSLLDQCFENYERSQYLICVPALLTILEGATAFPEGENFVKPDERRLFFEGKIAGSNRSFERMMWESLNIFFENLYKKSDFGLTRPSQLNRHWILHGRDETDWRQADVLRLFHALSTLCSVSSYGTRQ